MKDATGKARSFMDLSIPEFSRIFLELGPSIVGLAILARLASRWGFSSIPLYLLAGLAFGNGGLAPLNLSKGFIQLGAEVGVLLLLFMSGLEYSGEQLKESPSRGLPAGVVDFVLNFPPGLATGILLGWNFMAAVLLGGVTRISSSGLIAKVLTELNRLQAPETPVVLSILVLEDLAMAVYLPLIAVLLAGGGPAKLALSELVAIATVLLVIWVATRYGYALSRLAAHESDEIVLLIDVWHGAACGRPRRTGARVFRHRCFSGGHRCIGADCRTVPSAAGSVPRLLCRAILLFLRTTNRSGHVAEGAPTGRRFGSRNSAHESLDRVLGGATESTGCPQRCASGDGSGGAGGVLDCDCWAGRWSGAATRASLRSICALAGDSGAGTRQGCEVTARLARSATKLRTSIASGLSQKCL